MGHHGTLCFSSIPAFHLLQSAFPAPFPACWVLKCGNIMQYQSIPSIPNNKAPWQGWFLPPLCWKSGSAHSPRYCATPLESVTATASSSSYLCHFGTQHCHRPLTINDDNSKSDVKLRNIPVNPKFSQACFMQLIAANTKIMKVPKSCFYSIIWQVWCSAKKLAFASIIDLSVVWLSECSLFLTPSCCLRYQLGLRPPISIDTKALAARMSFWSLR